MFLSFFYSLREAGIPVTPTAFLRLQEALDRGLAHGSLDRFYVVARTLLIKREEYFDVYDRMFLHHFHGVDFVDDEAIDAIHAQLQDWLQDPLVRALVPEVAEEGRSLEELMKLFEERLKEQDSRHDGGGKWIGTGGKSPFGHSGFADRGIRIGGQSRMRSAIKVAGERRYKDYSRFEVLTERGVGEAVSRLRHMTDEGPRDQLDIDETIRETVRQAGEITLEFARAIRNKIRVVLFLDNGGWSMDPYIGLVSLLFRHIRDQITELETFYFHNCIYEEVWTDPQRTQAVSTEKILRRPKETKILVVGDASMAPEELESIGGASYRWMGSGPPGRYWLQQITKRFDKTAWINPVPRNRWTRAYGMYTITQIGALFPMFDLTLGGLEEAVEHLTVKKR
ncbi:MAG: VWA domain-containing protein [Planctomycetota bacterium]|nr:VWA domain-containing protein [Planctomycetota bacterium]